MSLSGKLGSMSMLGAWGVPEALVLLSVSLALWLADRWRPQR